MSLSIIILAAGKGKRMMSSLPKVMHQLGGTSLLEHVVKAAESLNPTKIHVIYGNGGDSVKNALPHLPVNWVFQQEQLGTGHAVMQALPDCNEDDQVLVLYGDVPVITTETLQKLLSQAPESGVGVLVANFKNPTGFGRIIRDQYDQVVGIVEEKDANAVQKSIHEINTGIITAPARLLSSCLPRVKNSNAQNEYYLTDVIGLTVADGLPVSGIEVGNVAEVQGVNDPWQLATVERYYQQQKARALTMAGVIVMDPARLDIRGDATIAASTRLDVNVILEGDVTIGAGCEIGAGSVIRNSTIADHVQVLPNSVIDGAVIESQCTVGPFARLRPGTVMKIGSKVGNFVEVKNTTVGEGSKASHLTYLGDAAIGRNVNVGAGVITCNYDGVNKWQTEIGDNAFIGSNVALVAPIKVGANATVGAGSTISRLAPENELTVTRSKQVSVSGWKRPTEKKNKEKVMV